jgi:hypothetical protein
VHIGFWWGNVREGDHFEDPEVNGRIILKWTFDKCGGTWNGLNWLWIETCGGLS